MKLTKYLTIFAASAAVLCSCNDLEQPPTTQYTDANFWSPERAEYLVNMAYSQMYSAERMWRDEALSDNFCETRGGNETDIRKGNALVTFGRFKSEWSDMYGGIKTCHIFLDNVDSQDIEESKKENFKAQVRFIRAYMYLRLVSFYGDVPFFTTDISLDEANTISRTPRAEIMKFIHDEMAAIIPNLPAKSNDGRITKAAAAMLDARAYLYDSNWGGVESTCKAIMSGQYGDYKLAASYAGLFDEQNEYSDDYNNEVILARGHAQGSITWGGGDYNSTQDMIVFSIGSRTPDAIPVQSLVDNYLTLDGYTIDEAPAESYDPQNPYVNRDPRMDATVVYDGYDWKTNAPFYYDMGYAVDRIVFADGFYKTYVDTEAAVTDQDEEDINGYCRTGYGTRKWFSPQGFLDWNSGQDIIMMRYADVLLMYAEAMEAQGKLTESVWNETIRPLRERAGFTADRALNFPTGGNLKQIVRNERRSELAIEGLRYFDIIRWKAGSEYLNGTVKGAGFTTWTETYVFNESRDYLWSVPEEQYLLNPNLLPNNPGW